MSKSTTKIATPKAATIDLRHNLRTVQHFSFLTLLAAAIYLLLCSNAFALSGFTPVGIVLCNVVTMIWSDIGRGIATLAVMVTGIMATLGKVTWGHAMLVAIGISLTFGAPIIVPQMIFGNNVFGTILTGFVGSCV